MCASLGEGGEVRQPREAWFDLSKKVKSPLQCEGENTGESVDSRGTGKERGTTLG
jgi:hypothetical protein